MDRFGGDPPLAPRLDDRVLEVLAQNAGRLAFNGLRRTLRAHPESLTRALRRLERDGAIRRTEGGYELSAPLVRDGEPSPPGAVRTVASVELPPYRSRSEVFGHLSGRWFGRLRWVGLFDHPGDPWLVWGVEGRHAHVMLSMRAHRLRVLTEEDRTKDPTEADEAGFELLTHALSRLWESAPAKAPTVTRFAASDPSFSLGPN